MAKFEKQEQYAAKQPDKNDTSESTTPNTPAEQMVKVSDVEKMIQEAITKYISAQQPITPSTEPLCVLSIPKAPPVQGTRVTHAGVGMSQREAEHILDFLCKKVGAKVRMNFSSFSKSGALYSLDTRGAMIPVPDRKGEGVMNVMLAHGDGCQARIDLDRTTFAESLWVWLHKVAKISVVPQIPPIPTEAQLSARGMR